MAYIVWLALTIVNVNEVTTKKTESACAPATLCALQMRMRPTEFSALRALTIVFVRMYIADTLVAIAYKGIAARMVESTRTVTAS